MRQITYIFICCIGFLAGCKNQRDENELRPEFSQKLHEIDAALNNTQYDSAQVLILQLKQKNSSYLEKYLVHCYDAEVLYYNMIPELAYSNVDAAYRYAELLNRNDLRANCENFLGLFKLIENKPKEAQTHFHKAWDLLSESTPQEYLVKDYQILSNLAETNLLLENPDSALFYAEKGFIITQEKQAIRGSALNYWNAGEAFLQKRDYPKAEKQFSEGIELLHGTHNDVLCYLFAGLIKSAVENQEKERAEKWLLESKKYIEKESSVLARNAYYKEAIRAANLFNFEQLATEMNREQLAFINRMRDRELGMQAKVLSNYFEEINTNRERNQKKLYTNRIIQIVLSALLCILLIIIYIIRKIWRQKIYISEIKAKSEREMLLKEKELGEMMAKAEAIEQERIRISKELHDDIGSSISSIKIYTDLARKNALENPQKAKELAEKTSAEIKQIEENISDLIWAVYTNNNSMQNLIMRMKQYAFDVLTAKEIQTEFIYPHQLDDLKLPIEFRKNILSIFKEFVNNTVKYSHATHFHFSIENQTDELLVIKISDDGIGFDTTIRCGKGLENMIYRAKEMNGNMELTSTLGKGTFLRLTYPLQAIGKN